MAEGLGKLLLVVAAGGFVNKLLIRSFWALPTTGTPTTNPIGLLSR
jgi:hypothetical protein